MEIRPISAASHAKLCLPFAMVLTLATCDSPIEPPGGGELTMNFSPVGASLDADGYLATIDSVIAVHVPIMGQVEVWLENGVHEVELWGLATNCVVDGPASRTIEIVDGEPARVEFEVECTEVWRELSFTSGRDGHSEIYATDPTGARTVRLTADTASDTEAVWAPDGRSVAFFREGAIYLAESGSIHDPTLLREPWGAPLGNLTWSPDGLRLAVEEFIWEDWCPESFVWILDTGTAERSYLSNGESPSWSPDGTRILMSYGREPCGPTGLRLVDVDGSDPVDLTTGALSDTEGFAPGDFAGTWSPDGTRIAFSRSDDGQTDIYTMAVDGSDLRRLTFHPAHDWDPAWSPDGQWIAFVSLRDGNSEVYVIEADGSNPVNQTTSEPLNVTNHPGPDTNPAWRPETADAPRR